MKLISKESIERHQTHGYKVIRLGKFFTLVRKYSIYCTSSFWKKYLSPYVLVKIVDEIDYAEYLKFFTKTP